MWWHHEHQDVRPAGQREQPRPDGQLDRPGRRPADRRADQVVPVHQRGPSVLATGHRQRRPRAQDVLVRPAAVRPGRRCAALVPRDDVAAARGAARAASSCPVSRSASGMLYVRGRALQLVEEPQPLLGERQRQPAPAAARRPAAAGPHRRRPRRPRAASAAGRRGTRTGPGPARSTPEHGADPADQPGGQQRVAAEVEEVVVDRHRGQAEHLGEQPAQDLLRGGARRPAAGRGRRPGAGSARRSSLPLAVSGSASRTTIADGHHVARAALRRARPRRSAGSSAAPAAADRRTATRRLSPGWSSRTITAARPTPGRRREHGFDLAGLDPEAAQLDLVVGAAEELQLPGAVHRGQVAGAVHPRARRTVRVRPRTAPRSAPDGRGNRGPDRAPATYSSPVTPGGTGRSRSSSTYTAGVPDRPADRRYARARSPGRSWCAADRDLGRPVRVDHRAGPPPAADQLGRRHASPPTTGPVQRRQPPRRRLTGQPPVADQRMVTRSSAQRPRPAPRPASGPGAGPGPAWPPASRAPAARSGGVETRRGQLQHPRPGPGPERGDLDAGQLASPGG